MQIPYNLVVLNFPTMQIKRNPCAHTCHSTRRSGQVKQARKFWIVEVVKEWLVEDAGVRTI